MISMSENETREALEGVRKDAKDPTLTLGDTVFCRGVYATVTGIHTYAPDMHPMSPIRNDWNAVEVVTDTNESRWHGIEPEPQDCGPDCKAPCCEGTHLNRPVPESGYTPCACRDCMDVAVSSDVSKPALCLPCKGAECEPWRTTDVPESMWYGAPYDCQRDDAYGEC